MPHVTLSSLAAIGEEHDNYEKLIQSRNVVNAARKLTLREKRIIVRDIFSVDYPYELESPCSEEIYFQIFDTIHEESLKTNADIRLIFSKGKLGEYGTLEIISYVDSKFRRHDFILTNDMLNVVADLVKKRLYGH
jgi:hypothetical protein